MSNPPTQAEITRVVAHLVRQSCAESGHAPHERIATHGDPIGVFYCECGAAIWTPKVTG